MTAPLRASLSHSKRFYVSLASLFHPSPPSPPQAHTPTKPQLLTLSKALAQISPHLPLCPHCDFPISNALMHSCEDMREAQEDHTGESKYRMELPAAQGVGKPGLDSWANLFKTRKFTQARTTRDQRLLTRELTYPITVAQFMYGAKPYSYPLQTKEGTKILERLYNKAVTQYQPPTGIRLTGKLQLNPSPMRLFLISFHEEHHVHMLNGIWRQLAYLFPHTFFEIHVISHYAKEQPRDFDQFKHIYHTVSFLDDLKDQLGPYRPGRDLFFLFNSAYGDPKLQTDEVKDQMAQILSTRCLTVLTASNMDLLHRDANAIKHDFGVLESVSLSEEVDIDDQFQLNPEPAEFVAGPADYKQQSLEWVLHPVENNFRSWYREIIPSDPDLASYRNCGVMALVGTGLQVEMVID